MLFKAGIQIFSLSSLMAFTGCASMFGPYVPLQATYSALPTEEWGPSREASAEAGTAGVAQPEFDADVTQLQPPSFEVPSTPDTPTVQNVPSLRPVSELSGAMPSEPKTAEVSPQNPFAVIEQEMEAATEPSFASVAQQSNQQQETANTFLQAAAAANQHVAEPFKEQTTTAQNPFASADANSDTDTTTGLTGSPEISFGGLPRRSKLSAIGSSPASDVRPATVFVQPAVEKPEDVVEVIAQEQVAAPIPQPPVQKERLRHGIVRQTSAEQAVRTVSAGLATTSNNTASTFHQSVPRLASGQPGCPIEAACCEGVPAVVQAYPDEYICDGGDRGYPVHYYGGEMQGLDTEDTVAEFKDHEGGNHVNASNRVCVYAPRFGSVQTITGPGIDVKVDKAAGARDVSGLGTLEERLSPGFRGSRSGAAGMGTRSSASGIETSQPAHMSEKSDGIVQSERVDQGLESKTSLGMGLIAFSDTYDLSVQITEPGKSNNTTALGLKASTSQATQTYSTFRVQALLGSEEGGRKGEVKIMKEASPMVAKPGDTVTFRIHFRNTGDHNVTDVRIIDNLTPRLIYTDGSGQIQIANQSGGSLTVASNQEGSQTLVFELDEPLQGGQTGTITFEAVVR